MNVLLRRRTVAQCVAGDLVSLPNDDRQWLVVAIFDTTAVVELADAARKGTREVPTADLRPVAPPLRTPAQILAEFQR